jgi:hypothetical protein
MALDRIWQLDVTGPASNSNYQSATIAENGPPSAINNALRALGSMVARELAWQASAISASVSTNLVTSSTGLYVPIVGSGAINNFGVIPGEQPSAAVFRIVEFSSSASLSHGSNLILVGGASRRTQPGDVGMYVHEGAGSQWRELFYSRADGSQLAPSISATTLTAGSISASAVSAVNMRASGAISAASMSVTNIVLTGVTSLSASIANATTYKLGGDTLTTLMQRSVTTNSTYQTLDTPIPSDNTIPQVSEGELIFEVSFTPKSANSTISIKCTAMVTGAAGAARVVTAALFKDGATNAIAANGAASPNSVYPENIVLIYEESAGSTSARTYSVRAGSDSGDAYLNGTSAERLYGGVSRSYLIIEEWL